MKDADKGPDPVQHSHGIKNGFRGNRCLGSNLKLKKKKKKISTCSPGKCRVLSALVQPPVKELANLEEK